jgi:23S rRNA (cytosine1962-C5)-methyltransferase
MKDFLMFNDSLACPKLDLAPQLPKKARPDQHARVLFSNQVDHLEDHLLSPERCSLVHVPLWGGRVAVYSKTMVNACVALPAGFSAGLSRTSGTDGHLLSRADFLVSVTKHLRALHQLKGCFVDSAAEAFRMVHGDADGLPGIVVDSYPNARPGSGSSLLVVQSSSPVGDFLLATVTSALKELFPDNVLFERSTGQGRKLLGLDERIQTIAGVVPEVMETRFCDLNMRFRPGTCQKTGLFLDQRANLMQLRDLIGRGSFWGSKRNPSDQHKRPLRVLDLCSYAGAWSALIANSAGFENMEMTLVDQDPMALELAADNVRQNAKASSVIVKTACTDVFAFLSDRARTVRDSSQARADGPAEAAFLFDIVIADPPAFAKSRKNVPEARRAYARLNRLVMTLVAPEGLLVTCSCSRNIEAAEFRLLVEDQLVADHRLKQMEWIHLGAGKQSLDHTIPVGRGVSDYLKCQFYQLRSLE